MSSSYVPDGYVRRVLTSAEAVLIALFVFYVLYEFLLSHVEGDQAFLLYAAQQVLAGVQLDGPRLIETNPPLIVWFSEIPAALSHLLHTDPVTMLRVVVSGLLAGSALTGASILRRSKIPAALSVQTAQLLWALSFFLIVITQPAEFGQREQLLLALFVPYLLAVGTDAVAGFSMPQRIVLGVAAGAGICFKPHHVLTLACLEVFIMTSRRSVRRLMAPELIAACMTGLLYLGAVRLLTPAYLSDILPLLGSTYWALGQFSFTAMVFHVGLRFTVSVLVLALLWWFLRKRLACPEMEGALLAAAVGATLAFFVQHTGWYHQGFPATALLEITVAWLLLDLLRAVRWPRMTRTAWVAATLCGVLAFAAVAVRKRHAHPDQDTISSELAHYPPGTTVYAFTVSLSHFTTVLDHRLVWGSRFAHLWMLPAIRDNESGVRPAGRAFHALAPERVEELAEIQRTELAQDLSRTRPQYVFVERCPATQPCESYTAPFNIVQWFSQSPEFAGLWSHYHYEKPVQDFDVYVRKD